VVVSIVQEGLYPLLLRFIDMPGDIASMALELLVVLPTHPALSDGLAAALDGPGGSNRLSLYSRNGCTWVGAGALWHTLSAFHVNNVVQIIQKHVPMVASFHQDAHA